MSDTQYLKGPMCLDGCRKANTPEDFKKLRYISHMIRFLKKIFLIYIWLPWVFIAASGPSLAVGATLWLQCASFSL